MAILNTASLASQFDNGSGQTVSITTNSNTKRTNNLSTDIKIVKTASANWALPEYVLTVTTTITNDTDLSIDTFKFLDTLSTGASFVAGSVKIGTVEHSDFNPITGFVAPVTLDGSGASVEISFQIKIDKYPEVSSIKNSSQITLNLDSRDFTLSSEEVTIDILDNQIWLNKSASSAVVSGDELTYTIVISNSGNFTNTNLTFTDPTPSGTTFVPGSVIVNNQSQPTYNPDTGFSLDDLSPNDEITVQFKVRVD